MADRTPDKRYSRAMEIFGQRIKRRRDELSITQEKLGELAELHPSYVASTERGERNPSLTNVIRIADGLDIDVAELVSGLHVEPRSSK